MLRPTAVTITTRQRLIIQVARARDGRRWPTAAAMFSARRWAARGLAGMRVCCVVAALSRMSEGEAIMDESALDRVKTALRNR